MLRNAPIIPYIPVANVARARKFYEEKVGLKAKQEYAGGVIYECGNGSWAFMYPSSGAGTSKASTAFWAVDDVAAEVAELKARGVVFEEYNMPGIKMKIASQPEAAPKLPGSKIPRAISWPSAKGFHRKIADQPIPATQ